MNENIISITKSLRTNTAQVLCGDCRKVIPHAGQFDFIFADPPFNIGQDYNGYIDNRGDFNSFTNEWVSLCWDACDGVLALHGPDDMAERYIQAAAKLGMRRIAWINWHYRFGQCMRSNWIDARCHCLVYAKNGTYTWNPDAVLVESDRSSTYNDTRIHDHAAGGSRLPGTVWGIPSDGQYWGRVQGTNKERRPSHPNQLPEVYLERLISAYTNPGDRILEPFAGSGTTIAVATELRRSCVTIDISHSGCESVKERLRRGTVRVKRPVPQKATLLI